MEKILPTILTVLDTFSSTVMLIAGISAISCAAALWLRSLLTYSFLDEGWFMTVLAICGLTLTIHGLCAI